MTTHNNLISIIIACRNGTNYIAEAITGLRQQGIRIEIIVIDDGATDNTAQLATSLGSMVRSIPHSGLSAARNEGLRLCTGDMILFHDHDDIMRSGTLQRLVEALQEDETPDIVMAQAKDFVSPELDEIAKAALAPRPDAYYGLLSGAVLFQRNVFDRIGSFSEQLSTSQTLDILTRAEKAGFSIKRLPFIAVDRRLHESNMGRTMRKDEYKNSALLLRQKLFQYYK